MPYYKVIKFLFSEFFKILKCVTKLECLTSRVRKDARGYWLFYFFKYLLVIFYLIFLSLLPLTLTFGQYLCFCFLLLIYLLFIILFLFFIFLLSCKIDPLCNFIPWESLYSSIFVHSCNFCFVQFWPIPVKHML